jgi:hypothetical protein
LNLPYPTEREREQLEEIGITFDGYKPIIPFFWDVHKFIYEPKTHIVDFRGRLKVIIKGNRYFILNQDDKEVELK